MFTKLARWTGHEINNKKKEFLCNESQRKSSYLHLKVVGTIAMGSSNKGPWPEFFEARQTQRPRLNLATLAVVLGGGRLVLGLFCSCNFVELMAEFCWVLGGIWSCFSAALHLVLLHFWADFQLCFLAVLEADFLWVLQLES